MKQMTTTHLPCRWPIVGMSVRFTLAVLAVLAVLTFFHDEAKRLTLFSSTGCCMVFVLSPYLSSSMTADPGASSSADKMTPLFTRQLPIVAAMIEAHRLREIATAQIGGLYGP